MDVFIDKLVHQQIIDFYEASMQIHITLDEVTVTRKMLRLYDSLESLGSYASIYPLARLKPDWQEKGYKEFVFEDFHFAFQIYQRIDGTQIVRVHDACHSFLYK